MLVPAGLYGQMADSLEDSVSNQSGFEKQYSDESFWDKLSRYAKSAGREVVEKALLLYYAAQEEDTPAWAKVTIVGALGYFISLIDAVPDITPIIGYSDDLGVLVMALAAVSSYINQNVRDRAQQKLATWFGEASSPNENNYPAE